MPEEYNPMEDLGLRNERFMMSACEGAFITNDYLRGLAGRFVKNGTALYDAIARYEMVSSFILQRSTDVIGNKVRMLIPFLKAGGITDHDAYMFAKEDLSPMPGSHDSLSYLSSLLPTFLVTNATDHLTMAACDEFGLLPGRVEGSKIEFDSFEIDRGEAKKLREMADTLTRIQIDRGPMPSEAGESVSEADTRLFYAMDDIFTEQIPQMGIFDTVSKLNTYGANERSYSLLNIRRSLQIDFDDISYVGHDVQDSLCMELVKESDGLSISFNGDDFAVREANIAVIGDNSIAAAVLTAEFYDYGIDAVFEMADNWNREYLSTHRCSDRNLMDKMLEQCKRRLPVVRRVTRENADVIAEESMAYRRKMEERFRRH